MIIYLKTAEHAERRRRFEDDLQGRLAMYRLLLSQRQYCGEETSQAERELEKAFEDEQAHRQAPAGTCLVARAPGNPALIWVMDEDRNELYFGPASGYRPDA